MLCSFFNGTSWTFVANYSYLVYTVADLSAAWLTYFAFDVISPSFSKNYYYGIVIATCYPYRDFILLRVLVEERPALSSKYYKPCISNAK